MPPHSLWWEVFVSDESSSISSGKEAIEESKYPYLLANGQIQTTKHTLVAMAETTTTTKEKEVIGVVGGGQMGSGIAQVAAVSGFDVWLHDTDPAVLDRAVRAVSSSIGRFVSKGKLSSLLIKDARPRRHTNLVLLMVQMLIVMEGLLLLKHHVRESLVHGRKLLLTIFFSFKIFHTRLQA